MLGGVLGQVPGFFLVGELRYIWDRGLLENSSCSCGMPFQECPVWKEIVYRAFENVGRVDPKKMYDLRESGLHSKHLLMPLRSRRGPRARMEHLSEYTAILEHLYHAVRSVNQCRVIIDTSKFPSYGYILQNIPDIELYVLHLVRDPRAVAYSWESRKKPKLDASRGSHDLMASHSSIESSLVWNEWNFVIEKIWNRSPERYMRLRYEDLVQNPQPVVESILEFVDEKEAKLPFLDERRVSLNTVHTFSGNPNRFHGGTVKIEPDDAWNSDMSYYRQMMVSALTWPGLLRYGYRLRPQRELSKSVQLLSGNSR